MKVISYLFFHPVYTWIFAFILFLLLYILYKNRAYEKFIGKAGEHWVKKELKKLNKNKYLVLNDIFLNINNKSSQIDHIVISEYGIFVIETKHISGKIVGDKYGKYWDIYKGKQLYQIKNPIHQNYGHIKTLEELLNININNLISIVCISSQTKINVNAENVIPIYKLIEYINKHKNIKINDKEEIYNKIASYNIKEKKIRKDYIKEIKNNIKTPDPNICPYCDSSLIERISKEGHKFIGCTNFPKCKYVRDINKVVNKKINFWKYYK